MCCARWLSSPTRWPWRSSSASFRPTRKRRCAVPRTGRAALTCPISTTCTSGCSPRCIRSQGSCDTWTRKSRFRLVSHFCITAGSRPTPSLSSTSCAPKAISPRTVTRASGPITPPTTGRPCCTRTPYREGNGRSIRLWMEDLAAAAGHQLDWTLGSADRNTHVAVAAAHGEYEPMPALLTVVAGGAVGVDRDVMAFDDLHTLRHGLAWARVGRVFGDDEDRQRLTGQIE